MVNIKNLDMQGNVLQFARQLSFVFRSMHGGLSAANWQPQNRRQKFPNLFHTPSHFPPLASPPLHPLTPNTPNTHTSCRLLNGTAPPSHPQNHTNPSKATSTSRHPP